MSVGQTRSLSDYFKLLFDPQFEKQHFSRFESHFEGNEFFKNNYARNASLFLKIFH